MNIKRAGHLSAEVVTASGLIEFRVTHGLDYYDRSGIHGIEANNGQGKEFYLYLPAGIENGSHKLELGLTKPPMVIHVTDNAEAELFPGILELTVGGDAQFAGSFSGTDANGVEVRNGSFRMEHKADI